MVPVLGWEVVEGQQRVAVLEQAGDRLLVLGRVLLGEGGDRRLGSGTVGSLPNLAQILLRRGLDGLRQLVHDIDRLVHPAALMPGGREDLLERLPEAERAVAGGQLGRDDEAAGLEPDQQLMPALRTLAHADLEANQLL